ncbi:MAG TPA: copper resistance system multicopper oxidase [Woeseiaceae bacterium]|nr:copper resistance system multicopper oxidase [Woeseiaceae bacterium]
MKRSDKSRRDFLQSAAGLSAVTLLNAFVPAWARAMQVKRDDAALQESGSIVFDLAIRQHQLEIAGGMGNVVSINNSVPGPLLEWYEGRDVVLNVANEMNVDTSIHWHGILLPFEMDGVPGVTFRGIQPSTTFRYQFPVRQSGTYWYHSHSGLQEQSGCYGPLVVHPREPDPTTYDRDYIVMLSDWTFEDPHRVMRNLKKMGDYYNYQQFSLADLYGTGDMSRREAWKMKLAWDQMRMMATDILDVTGSTYTYLMNGLHPAGNWTGLFAPGERIRLRFINGSAMSYFNVRIPGLPMTVIAADGQNVHAVETDEFQFGAAETYDVIVEPKEESTYTIMAEAMDRSGFAAGTLTMHPGSRAAIPPLRKRPLLTMVDMGMDMSGTDMDGTAAPTLDDTQSSAMGEVPMDHSRMTHAEMGHKLPVKNDHAGHDMGDMSTAGPIIARHGPDHHGPGNIGVAAVERNRLGERGLGLENLDHRVLVYTDLKRLANDFDDRPPAREIELHLTGHMERYMWSFDGKQFHEVDGPIEFSFGERLRLTMVNDTMMNHPIHLHGMWMELENGHGSQLPRKHTINMMPAARTSVLISADAPGRWAFHCHLLYHMDMGMFRVVRVS